MCPAVLTGLCLAATIFVCGCRSAELDALKELHRMRQFEFSAGEISLLDVLDAENRYLFCQLDSPWYVRENTIPEIQGKLKKNLEQMAELKKMEFELGGCSLSDQLEVENKLLYFLLTCPDEIRQKPESEIRTRLKKNLETQVSLRKTEFDLNVCTQDDLRKKEEELKRLPTQ